ncbi:MAG: OmpA family protein [Pseudomonadales bacterium]
MSRTVLILLGLLLFSLLVWWAETRHSSQIEGNVELRSQAALNESGFDAVTASADGRDVTLTGQTEDATRRITAEALVADLNGVRLVVNDIKVQGSEALEAQLGKPEPVVNEPTVAVAPAPTPEPEPEPVVAPEPAPIQAPVAVAEPTPKPKPVRLPTVQLPVVAEDVAEEVTEELAEVSTEDVVEEVKLREPEPALAADVDYKLSVAARADGIFLTGTVNSTEEKRLLEDQARLAFPDVQINNRLQVGSNELSIAQSLAPRGLGMLTELSSGTLDVDVRGLRVNGRASSAERREVLEQKLSAARRENPSLRIVSNIVVAGALDNNSCQVELNRLIAREKILFENEKAAVNDESHDLLNSLADVAQRCNARIEIGGHTDSYGDDAYNQWLSELRANTVKEYLIEQGVSAQGLSSVGYGEAQPIAENTTRTQRAKNRRIEFRVLGD